MWSFRNRAAPPIAWFGGEDAEMNAAIAQAQAGFAHFAEVVTHGATDAAPPPEVTLVKYAFVARKGAAKVEHVFLGDVHGRDGALWGTVDADPVHTDEVAEGDLIEIDHERVSDWLYVVDGKGTGGFTFSVMWKNFSHEEKRAYGSQPPFVWLTDTH